MLRPVEAQSIHGKVMPFDGPCHALGDQGDSGEFLKQRPNNVMLSLSKHSQYKVKLSIDKPFDGPCHALGDQGDSGEFLKLRQNNVMLSPSKHSQYKVKLSPSTGPVTLWVIRVTVVNF
ncbi:hypothetical protein CLV98_12521 [Dyadobacter jejuensis]|uniref:Uncharacterized protein n=1 Tax=Dyadobacter jejuensis TaxID=1082580 RepID=A0A316A7P5_9BACT|nr:hypothetical protein CLV98_12521 [Dyadobacter jejuensis]